MDFPEGINKVLVLIKKQEIHPFLCLSLNVLVRRASGSLLPS